MLSLRHRSGNHLGMSEGLRFAVLYQHRLAAALDDWLELVQRRLDDHRLLISLSQARHGHASLLGQLLSLSLDAFDRSQRSRL
jgi:hypothetical protein